MKRVLVIVFLLGISLPLTVQLSTRHKLTEIPSLTTGWQFPQKFAAYYGKNFGLRAELLRVHAHAMYRLLRQSPSDKVLIGKDDWLYYADDSSLEDFRSLEPYQVSEMEVWRQVLETRQDWLAKRGSKMITVFACDKYVIYPEYMPAGYRRKAARYRVEELAEYLQRANLTIVPLHQPLRAGKTDRLYHRTDTHWNDRGAYIGYREILAAMKLRPLDYMPVEQQTPGWDLARLMGLADILREEDRQLTRVRRAKIVEIDREDPTWNVGRVALEVDDPALPKLVMFRDSFGSALVSFLAEHFRRSLFLWQHDFDPAIIENEKPDYVVWEITSRRCHSAWFRPANPPLP
ncbi:MAG: hypothetical protein PCFJNLEI_03694 [Verrucomicrobiae bacterium]|nr:hypothetical protein [Verrucomicrobiae bacterium]